MKLNYLFILIFSFFSTQTQAQFPNIATDKTFGGSNNDSFNAFVKVGDFYYLGGSTSSNDGDISDTGFGNEDAWLMKTDESLNPIYDTLFGGDKNDYIQELVWNNDKLIIGIHSNSNNSTGNLTAMKKGHSNVILMAMDNHENIIWQQSYGGDNHDKILDLDVFSNGDLLLSCISLSDSSFDKSENNLGQFFDIWLLRINPENGDIIWENTLGGSDSESWVKCTIDNEDNIYANVTSLSNSGHDKSEPNIGFTDIWLVKLSDSGNVIWDKTIGGNGVENYGGIEIINNMLYYYVTSTSDANSFKSENALDNFGDIWIVKSDLDGNILSENTIASANYDVPNTLFNDENKLILCGTTSGSNNNDQMVNFSYDGNWILQLDTTLNIQNQRSIDGLLEDLSWFSACLNPSNYIFLIDSNSPAGLDKTDGALGGEDAWIVILSEDLGIENLNIFSTINLYPNPTENTINLSLENQEEIEYVQMFDLQGKEIIRTIKTQINLSGLNAGVYLIKVKSKNGNSYTERVVKK